MKTKRASQICSIDGNDTRSTRIRLVITTISVLMICAGVARADWLVMNDGSKVETQSAWEVEGDLILFEIQGHTLASVRQSDVDLEASRRLTAASSARAEAARAPKSSEPKRKTTFFLTDADVGHPLNNSASSDGEAKTADGPDVIAPEGGVNVTSWNTSDLPSDNGLRVLGTARNTSGAVVADLSVTIKAYDSTGDVMLSQPANLGARALGSQQSTSFAGDLVGVFSYDRIEFEVDYVAVERVAESDPATSTRRPEGR